jgi:hypothetical protein
MIYIRAFIQRRLLLILALAGSALAGSSPAAWAQGFGGKATAAALADPAFNRFIDLSLLQTAWFIKDASLLTDLGLQLAEGERVLQRTHRSITADQVLGIAAKLAAERKDKATLGRLAKALEGLNRPELSAQVATAQKFAGASRAPEKAVKFEVDKLRPDAFIIYRDTLDQVIEAKVMGDADSLDIIIQLTPEMRQLSDEQRKYIIKLATEARAALPKEGGELDPAAAALEKLFDESRGGGRHRQPAKEDARLKVRYEASSRGIRIVGDAGLAFKEGAKLRKGDLILFVGDMHAYGAGTDLSALVDQAYESDNTEVLVFEANGRRVKRYHLPPLENGN